MRSTLWDRITENLGISETVVIPQTYDDYRHLFNGISGYLYIIKDNNDPSGELDWCWKAKLDEITKDPAIDVLLMVYRVRIRLPWKDTLESKKQWYIDKEELARNRSDYKVIDVAVSVQRTDDIDSDINNNEIFYDPIDFDENPDDYEVTGVKYLVTWAWETDEKHINKDDVHTVYAQ